MRCFSCQSFSFAPICKTCLTQRFVPTPIRRELSSGLTVYALYPLEEIGDVIKTKYDQRGWGVITALGRHAFKYFLDRFPLDVSIGAIPIDDNTDRDYSHTALLVRVLNHRHIHPLYGSLRAASTIRYAGATKQYREENPRNLRYRGPKGEAVILVDDVITTGTTMQEAKQAVEQGGATVLFGLVLADAREVEGA